MNTTHKTAHARRHRIKIAAAAMLLAAAALGTGALDAAFAGYSYRVVLAA